MMTSWQEEYKLIAVKLAVGAVVAAVVAWVFVVPAFREGAALRGRIAAAQADLRRQEVLLPEQVRLEALLRKDSTAGFVLPEPAPVSVSEIGVLAPRFTRVALDAGLEVLDMVVSPSSLRSGGDRIKMQCVVFGDLSRFRTFYLAMGALPYVRQVDKLEMRAVPGGIEFCLDYWVLLNGARG